MSEQRPTTTPIQDVDQPLDDALTRLQIIPGRKIQGVPQVGGKASRVCGQLPAVLIEQGRLEPARRVGLYAADTLLEFAAFLKLAQVGLEKMVEK